MAASCPPFCQDVMKKVEVVVNNTCFILLLCVWQQAILLFCQGVIKEEEAVVNNTCFILLLCVCDSKLSSCSVKV